MKPLTTLVLTSLVVAGLASTAALQPAAPTPDAAPTQDGATGPMQDAAPAPVEDAVTPPADAPVPPGDAPDVPPPPVVVDDLDLVCDAEPEGDEPMCAPPDDAVPPPPVRPYPTHAPVQSFGAFGDGANQYSTPHGIAPWGTNLVIADTNNNRVKVVGQTNTAVRTIVTGAGSAPRGVYVDGDVAYVSLTGTSRVKAYDLTNGNELRTWGSPGAGADNLRSPYAVWVSGDRLFVADVQNDRIQVFDKRTSNTRFATIGPGFDTTDRLRHPHGLGVRDGELYVVDTFGSNLGTGGRVVVFSLDGTYRRQWNDRGDGVGLAEPYGIAFGSDGLVYIGEHGGGRVRLFTPTGETRGQFGARMTTGRSQLMSTRFMFAAGTDIWLLHGGTTDIPLQAVRWHACPYRPSALACSGGTGRTAAQITADCGAIVTGYGFVAGSDDAIACNAVCVDATTYTRNTSCP